MQPLLYIKQLDYIHSPAHGCIMQPPCVAPSGDSARVIAYIALCWDCCIPQQSHRVNYANQHSPFARRRHDFRTTSPPLSFGKFHENPFSRSRERLSHSKSSTFAIRQAAARFSPSGGTTLQTPLSRYRLVKD